ncbi:translation initiation factor IF-3 [Acidaminococcus sp. CAG:917]|nr:translation initiation factor IF-3 [Acidaminococcus sp. CAG:917]
MAFCCPILFYIWRKTTIKELQTNNQIRDREVRLISADGAQMGVMSSRDAQKIADDQGLDLVKISPNVDPPVCKIMDYGKFRYEQQKKEKEARKNQHIVELKEVYLSATIDVGDLTRLAKQAKKFIDDGNKVKASIRLKGRQQAHPEIAMDVIKEFIKLVGEDVAIEKAPIQEGRNIFVIFAPNAKK